MPVPGVERGGEFRTEVREEESSMVNFTKGDSKYCILQHCS